MVTRRSLCLVCDASAETGFGHWVRSTTLAQEMARRGWQISVVHAPDVHDRALAEGASRGWRHLVTGRAPTTLRSAVESFAPSVVVIDTYRIDADTIRSLRSDNRCSVLIDDLDDRGPLDADLVVNQNAGAERFDYRIPAASVLLRGPRYALLRTQFAELREESLERLARQPSIPSRIFVIMGGSDATGALSTVLESCLDAFPAARIRAVVPEGRAGAQDQRWQGSQVEVVRPTPEIGLEMAGADFVVTAGGTSVWELCALGRPFGVVVVADNQQDAANRLVDSEATVRLSGQPLERAALTRSLHAATADPSRLVARARRAAQLVDGAGCVRVADTITQLADRTTMTTATGRE